MADSYELFLRQFQRGALTSYPTTGTWQVGDFIFNSSPGGASPLGWVCTTGGSTGGTWAPVSTVQTVAATTVSAAGAITPATPIIDVDTGGFNITLTAPTALQTGSVISLVNDTASPCTLVAGSGTTILGNVTLSANSSAQVRAVTPLYYVIA